MWNFSKDRGDVGETTEITLLYRWESGVPVHR
jgi:hypothetical protein